MAVALHLPAISQAPVAREFPKVWEHRKDLSHWAKQDVPSLKLAGQLDTDHWAKLKEKHVEFVNRTSYGLQSNGLMAGPSSQKAPALSSAFQRYYYNQGKHREDLLKKTYTMYYRGKPMEKESSTRTAPQADNLHQPQVHRRPSLYNQRAKEGFKFWLESDPMVKRISLCSKYTFGSKSTFHGLGNAPRN